MKGIVLAGGKGAHLAPLTCFTNMHLLPACDRPTLYYPSQTLVDAGIQEIPIVTRGSHAAAFLHLPANGQEFGLEHLDHTERETEGSLAFGFPNGGWTGAGTIEILLRASNLVAAIQEVTA